MDAPPATSEEIGALLAKARLLAVEYHRLTGKPLGITGEIGEFQAAQLLKLELAVAREAGYDAIDANGRRLQIKARAIPTAKKFAGRVGKIDLKKPWDAVLLIVMDEMFTPIVIFEAERDAITATLEAPGSKARNERGSLAVTKFMSIGRRVWPS
ncbi:MAG: hypothetical protein IPK59_05150 [Rhodospirillaceae bacterium]|nr:hypothetical protein [Rhodospirillaceae bacterium]